MGRIARWSLVGLLGLIAMIIAIMWLAESRWARELLEDQISQRLNGREVAIAAHDIDWGWPLSLQFEGIRIANPDWAPEEHMLDLGALEIGVSLSALFKGNVVLERLYLQQPRIHLARREDGRASWSNLLPEDDEEDESGSGELPFELQAVDIDQGRFTYQDKGVDANVDVDFRTENPNDGPRRLIVDGKGRYQDDPVTLRLRSGAPSKALAGGSYPLEFQAALGKLEASFDGRLKDVAKPLSLHGKLDVSAPQQANLAGLLDRPALDLPDMAIQAVLDHDDKRWTLEEIDAQVGESALTGSLAVTSTERPQLDAQLSADRLKLEQWGVTDLDSPAEKEEAERETEKKAEQVADELPLDQRLAQRLAPLNDVDARIDLSVAAVSYGDTRLEDVSLKGSLEQGRLSLERLHVAQEDSEIAAHGWLESDSHTISANLDARMETLDLGQALAPLGYAELGVVDGRLHAGFEQGKLELDDTSVAYRAPDQNLMLQVKAESTTFDATDQEGVRLWGEGRREGIPFAYDVKVGPLLTLNSPDKRYPIKGWASSRKSRLDVDGSIVQPLKLSQVQGAFELSGPNPARLNRLIGLDLPALPPYRVGGELRMKKDLVRLLDLDGHFGDSDVSGDVRLRLDERSMLWATLNSRRLDLDDLAPLFGGTPQTGPGEAASARQQRRAARQAQQAGIFPEAKWNLEGLRSMDADVVYRADSVQVEDIPMSSLKLDLTLDEGVLTLEPLEAGIGGGRITSRVRMDARSAPLNGSLEFSLRNVNLKPLLRSAELGDIAEDSAGTLGGEGQLRFRGGSFAGTMANLDGLIELAMSGGRMDMLVMEALGLDVAEALTGALADAEKVPMQCAYTRLDATSGLVKVEQLFVSTSDSNMTGGGSIDLDREYMNLVFEAHSKDASLLASDSPIRLQGPLNSPSVDLVSRELVARSVLSVLGAVIAPPLAILPWVDLGTGEGVGPGCEKVMREYRQG
nr:AsmA family protein [uncultured Halomonas sp.]